MFIGHYALGFAGRKYNASPSLGTYFLAVQWLDLIWPLFVLAGIERVRIDPGNTKLTPLDFEYYPWSHSLLMAVAWSVLFGMLYFLLKKNRGASLLLATLVLSHWILDYITHRPDLPLAPFSETRLGLGLWNYPVRETILETVLFIAGAWLYIKSVRSRNRVRDWALGAFIVFLLGIHFSNVFSPPPPSAAFVGWLGLSQWLLVAWGYWIDAGKPENAGTS